ncbi:transmembrane protein 231 [Eurosta solidaginis]|uniref:transmembrane protein 231 n=1 Tax=Eurosta solidaginis TaxID=178769 RepID=UPI00353091D7
MKFIPLHTKNTAIVYKNALCSSASIIVLIFIILSVMMPVLLVSLLSPYSGISESRVLFEQPRLHFKFQTIFTAETEMKPNGNSSPNSTTGNLIVCSTFPQLNAMTAEHSGNCEGIKYWTDDFDHDGTIDRAHFEQQLTSLPGQIKNFDFALIFEAKLKHKCLLAPPALLTYHTIIPTAAQLSAGVILLKAELQLKQYIEFTCPFLGRNAKTHFHNVHLNSNDSHIELEDYQLPSLLEQLKANPAYFQLSLQDIYYRRAPGDALRIQLELDVLQVPARYHLSVWERLGQFWLYFASFFGISFYVMNKVKDYLFGRHIIRAWEVIPWKKLY